MKQKTFSLVILTILSLVMLVGMASAVALNGINLVSSPSSVSNDAGSFDIVFTLTNEGVAGNLYYNLSNFTSAQTGLAFSFNNIYIEEDAIETVTATVSFNNGQTGVITGNINGGNTDDAVDETLHFSVSLTESTSDVPEDISECVLTGTTGNLKIEIDDINNIAGFGDDTEWLPLDEIEVDIKVENNGDEKIKNIEIKWGLYDVDNNDWIFDEKESDFNLKDGDDKTITVTFDLGDPSDYEDGNNFVFYVWATAEDGEYDDQEICVSDSDEIEIIIESDFVVAGNIEYLNTVSCGDSVPISAKIWNIGDSDQDAVSVVVYNKELGFSQIVEVGDINAFDSEAFDMILELPTNLDEKLYQFKMEVRDEDGDVYVNDYDDDEAVSTLPLTISGCGNVAQTASVSASLESGGKAGSPLVVRTTITNSGDKSATYTLNAASYTGWASSATIDQSTFILNAGNSKDALITFAVNKDAEGTKFFDLEVISDNELVLKQPVSVSIEKSGFSLADGNSYIWFLGILIVVLIIAIIIVAVRLGRR